MFDMETLTMSNDEINKLVQECVKESRAYCTACRRFVHGSETSSYDGLTHREHSNKECGGNLEMAPYLIYNYCKDLNLWHEIEKNMTRDEQIEYRNLFNIMEKKESICDWDMIHATAKEKAVIFLMVKGKIQ